MKREDIIDFISSHKTEFEQRFGIKRIGLFGSYARDEGREESDIDIVRLRDKMNNALRRRIERDVIYV